MILQVLEHHRRRAVVSSGTIVMFVTNVIIQFDDAPAKIGSRR